ncbi:MAG: hypothetical protein ABH857_01025 [Elusimicrobiota bacterium]
MITKYLKYISLIFLIPASCSFLYSASEVTVRLASDSAENGLWIENSNGVKITTITSTGNAYFPGNVGIGTHIAVSTLTVNGDIFVTGGGIILTDNTIFNSTAPYSTSYRLNSLGNGIANVMYVDDTAAVGIGYGMTIPAGSKFNINGTTLFRSSAVVADSKYLLIDKIKAKSAAGISLYSDDSVNRMFIDQYGNIGVGLNSPTAMLHVSSQSITNTQYLLRITTGTTSVNTLMAVSENVGVGTTNPTALFTVGDNTFQVNRSGNLIKINNLTYSWPSSRSADTFLKNDGSGNLSWVTAQGGLGGSGTAGYAAYFTSSENIGSSEIFESGGNIGIGTTVPGNYKLNVSTRHYVEQELVVSSITLNSVRAPDTNGMYITNDAGALGLFVGNAGNVGIATSSPQQKLDVTGKLRTSGSFFAGVKQGGTLTDSIKVYINDSYDTGTLDINLYGGIVTYCVKTPD